MRVWLSGGLAVLWTEEPSSGLCARLRRLGFESANECVWTGAFDSLVRLELPRALLPPGHPATWPRDWRPEPEAPSQHPTPQPGPKPRPRPRSGPAKGHAG